ncbi:unnamed protein product [Rotaria sordida]|uniref:Aspartate kinase n=1 Tax=Rotaria sordida TaxID=392033 RepID=A0A813RMC5_9BILA|nr:unnamed protein product [Rotaria sordida]CAF0786810.1 unnamed protein product [Rotaria sordida]CAF0806786.1 unnamed protein product [Rotaria sordida]CAF0815165.1 unnamed protein product [Rotaria sordida]CAF3489437.1 unnamed protein product [Rotaria sordida]
MSKSTTLTLNVLKENFIICRLPSSSSVPSWAFNGPFCSITKTNDELSIITIDNDQLPKDIQCERNWKCFKFLGPFSFDMTGVLTSILNPLAKADIGILAISTFDTDYVMVKDKHLDMAIDVLKQNGHKVNM